MVVFKLRLSLLFVQLDYAHSAGKREERVILLGTEFLAGWLSWAHVERLQAPPGLQAAPGLHLHSEFLALAIDSLSRGNTQMEVVAFSSAQPPDRCHSRCAEGTVYPAKFQLSNPQPPGIPADSPSQSPLRASRFPVLPAK